MHGNISMERLRAINICSFLKGGRKENGFSQRAVLRAGAKASRGLRDFLSHGTVRPGLLNSVLRNDS
jgi:hypothetical protein